MIVYFLYLFVLLKLVLAAEVFLLTMVLFILFFFAKLESSFCCRHYLSLDDDTCHCMDTNVSPPKLRFADAHLLGYIVCISP